VIYCDETSFMNTEVFYQVIIPIFEMATTVLICISTPMDTFNFYTALVNLIHPKTGLPIFNTHTVELVCKRCKKKKDPTQCKHNRKYIPPWKNENKGEIVRIIYKDMQHILKRESLYVSFLSSSYAFLFNIYSGVISDEAGSYIDLRDIKTFNEKPIWNHEGKNPAKYVVMFVDPNAGGENEMAIIAGTHYEGQRIVSIFIFFSIHLFVFILCSTIWNHKSHMLYIFGSHLVDESVHIHSGAM
jgi:hypothetical protein